MKTISINTTVIGSGAAGFAAAARLSEADSKNVAIITENVLSGTSRNAGSDKQTYYKLGLCGDAPDSPYKMARDLFNGGAVDGDTALVEAALSARCFMYLCELDIGFPQDRFGQYIGYRTDHDLSGRATSAGPLTSRQMTEALEKLCAKRKVKIYDKHLAIKVITKDNSVQGLLALDENEEPVFFRCNNVILATGGSACIYSDTVYPESQSGMTSLAINAGAWCKNLTQWQYGLASVKPSWNVSGTYMQVLPCFISVDEDGNEYDFLREHFNSEAEMASAVFKKGYEWPFDYKKLENGSSRIDYLVYSEKQKGRRVYLDYTKNLCDINLIEGDARKYLSKAAALFGTPAERLIHMNQPAYELYLSKGTDLKKEPLEISLCAQHCNGGIDVDLWWQTCVKGLFAIGEAAGTHGIYRPGGSALNAGQVGALRAAEYILKHRNSLPDNDVDEASLCDETNRLKYVSGDERLSKKLVEKLTRDMDSIAGAIRRPEEFTRQIELTSEMFNDIYACAATPKQLYKLLDMFTVRYTVLTAMRDYIDYGCGSCGGAAYLTQDGFIKSDAEPEVQLTGFRDGEYVSGFRKPRPVPQTDEAFETVWRQYRENENIY